MTDREDAATRFTRIWFVSMLLGAVFVSSCTGNSAERKPATNSATSGRIGAAQSKHGDAIIRCLSDKGWKVTDTGDSFEVDVGPEQQAAFDADDRACLAEVGASLPAPKLSEADFRHLYRHQLRMVECLRRFGYPPVDSPPSEQQ
ncbi:MAG: hypothetical protein V9G19_26490 [Tetrasphaera sp.]